MRKRRGSGRELADCGGGVEQDERDERERLTEPGWKSQSSERAFRLCG